MATRYEDPQLGTLIQIDEVSQLTGIPKPTIRLWRQDKYRHLAKLDHYNNGSTKAAWYRLADVEQWLTENGKDLAGNRSMFVKSEAPNGVRAPITGMRMDPRVHQALTAAKKITAVNVRKTQDKLFIDGHLTDKKYLEYLKAFTPALTDAWFKGAEFEPLAFPHWLVKAFPTDKKDPLPEQRERVEFMHTNMVRLIDADVHGRTLSVADVADLPLY